MITYDYNYLMADHAGDEHGITMDELHTVQQLTEKTLSRMDTEKKQGSLGFLNLPYDTEMVPSIRAFRKKCGDRFHTIAVVGIGGSALGPQALKNSLSHLYLNELSDGQRKGRYRVYFFDNVDPYEIRSLEDVVDLSKTIFLVISKSGGTTETNANFAIILDWLKKAVGDGYREQIVAITDPEKGVLRKVATQEGFTTFPVPANVGGRFSVLSAVGLVMAEFIGIDADALLAGARNVLEKNYGKPLFENGPLLNATFHYLFDIRKNKRINVLMPYTRKLFLFADWYRQLWAESLGKRFDVNNNEVMTGLTPVAALGTIDQHSQLQLYLEGPNDKVVTFLKLKQFDDDVTIPEFYNGIPEMDYLSRKSLRKLNGFEESATELALREARRPSASLILDRLNANTVGELIMFLEMQTAYAGYLYNIDPYDQPAVEIGKKFTFGLLDRPGFEQFKQKFEQGYRKNDSYII